MPAIRTNAAAALLGVSANTLRSWERRFGFPEPRRTAGGHRQYALEEIEALRAALTETGAIAHAVSLARSRGSGPVTAPRLSALLAGFAQLEADSMVHEALAVRSVEATVEEIVLPAVGALRDPDGATAEYLAAWRWATGWLAAQVRVAPPASRDDGVLVLEATAPYDLDALYAQALELGLRRVGLRTLTLPVGLAPERLARAVSVLAPRVVVLTGTEASRDALGRLVYAARRAGDGPVSVLDFRGVVSAGVASTVPSLGSEPLAARDAVLAVVAGAGAAPARPVRVATA